jgi:disulfide oxidoreductase YuzD
MKFIDVKKAIRKSDGQEFLNAISEEGVTYPLFVGKTTTVTEALAEFKTLGKAKTLASISLVDGLYGKQAVFNLDYSEESIKW